MPTLPIEGDSKNVNFKRTYHHQFFVLLLDDGAIEIGVGGLRVREVEALLANAFVTPPAEAQPRH